MPACSGVCNLSQFKAAQHVCDMPSKTNITLHLFLYLFMPSLISWYTFPTHRHSCATQHTYIHDGFCGLVWYCDCLIILCQCFCFIYDSVVLINEIISQTVMLHLQYYDATRNAKYSSDQCTCNGIFTKIILHEICIF